MRTPPVVAWRIAAETRSYAATDLSGTGAALNPGRWNDVGEHVLYCAESRALAVIETAAHVDGSGLPLNRFLVAIQIPGALWANAERVKLAELPVEWEAIPAGSASIKLGSRWYKEQRSAVLVVPSVVVREEAIIVLNMKHPDAKRIKAKTIRSIEYDRLFRTGA